MQTTGAGEWGQDQLPVMDNGELSVTHPPTKSHHHHHMHIRENREWEGKVKNRGREGAFTLTIFPKLQTMEQWTVFKNEHCCWEMQDPGRNSVDNCRNVKLTRRQCWNKQQRSLIIGTYIYIPGFTLWWWVTNDNSACLQVTLQISRTISPQI